MNNERKSKAQLIKELEEVSRRNAELEAAEAMRISSERKLKNHIDDLAALNRLAREVTASLSVAEVISSAQEQIQSIISPDISMIYLIEGHQLMLHGIQPENQLFRESGGEIKEVGQCLCGLVARDREPAYSPNIHIDPRCTRDECKIVGARSFAAIPLAYGEHVLGVLGLASFDERDFSERREFIEIIATHISAALQKASLYEEVEQVARQLDQQLSTCREIEKALREEHSFRSAVIENAAEGICVGHPIPEYPYIRFTLWNHRMVETTGYTMEEINTTGWYRAMYPDRNMRSKAMERVERMLLGDDLRDEEWQVTRIDGENRVLEISTTRLVTSDGISHMLALMHDVTEERRAAEALKRANDELEQRVQERTAELFGAMKSLEGEVFERRRTESALTNSEKKLRFLASRLLEVREEERRCLSREIHDAVAQELVAIKLMAENAQIAAKKTGSGVLNESLDQLVQVAQRTLATVRKMYTNLRPSVLDDFGVIAGISSLCGDMVDLYPSVLMRRDIRVKEDQVPGNLKIPIFRIVQEALMNTVKHSNADSVEVSFSRRDGCLELAINDNGSGFKAGEIHSMEDQSRGAGLACMEELARLSGGRFSIKSAPGKGTSVKISWLLHEKKRNSARTTS